MRGIEKGVLPYIKYGEIIVYTISTSIVFHAVSIRLIGNQCLGYLTKEQRKEGVTRKRERGGRGLTQLKYARSASKLSAHVYNLSK